MLCGLFLVVLLCPCSAVVLKVPGCCVCGLVCDDVCCFIVVFLCLCVWLMCACVLLPIYCVMLYGMCLMYCLLLYG